jgi:hypothetical protein
MKTGARAMVECDLGGPVGRIALDQIHSSTRHTAVERVEDSAHNHLFIEAREMTADPPDSLLSPSNNRYIIFDT